jgi:hypothetical protein
MAQYIDANIQVNVYADVCLWANPPNHHGICKHTSSSLVN